MVDCVDAFDLRRTSCERERMSLSQVQIIRSLGEALAWFERELSWNVRPGSLTHLTGRIGELYTAMLTRGQMALGVAQPGYDVVSAEGQRISVKTITTSTHADFNLNTIHLADRAVILRINVIEGEASIEGLFDGSIEELKARCNHTPAKLIYMVNKPPSVPTVSTDLAVAGTAQIGNRRVIQFENSSIAVETDGIRESTALPVLRDIARAQGISPLNGAGNPMNTRQLGAAIIAAMASSSAARFAWSDGDVEWLDKAGNALTSEQVKEMQAEARRKEAES